MKYNFDEFIDRQGTNSIKYDLRKDLFGTEDVMPLWVADMDFATPPFIRDAVIDRAKHPIYGYTFRGPSFKESIIKWMKERHNWDVDPDWICFSPGVVPAINMQVLSYSKPGDGILVQPPVYFPFFTAVQDHDRKLIVNELVNDNGHYIIDFDDFEKKAKESKIFILCHPHNPVGRAWSKEELEKMVNICTRHNVLIISDEIHSDLILNESQHIPIARIDNAADRTIACYAPSKTFNLAGLATSFIIIPNSNLRKSYEKTLNAIHIGMGNIFGFVALEAAYMHGGSWLDQLNDYLRKNADLLDEFIVRKIPEIKLTRPEATYLAWIDFRNLKIPDKELREFIIKDAGLGLNDGERFGHGGEGFLRMNIALPRKKLEKALLQLESAIRRRAEKI